MQIAALLDRGIATLPVEPLCRLAAMRVPWPGQGGRVDRTERFYKIDQLLKERKVVTFAALREALGV